MTASSTPRRYARESMHVLVATLLLGCALGVYLIVRFDIDLGAGAWQLMFSGQLTAFVTVACVGGASVAMSRLRVGRAAHLLALGVALTLGGVVTWWLLDRAWWTYNPMPGGHWLAYIQIEYTLLAGAAVLAWVDRRRAGEALAALHEAQRMQREAAKRTVEVGLATMQARVPSQFLFDTLDRVRMLRRTDPPGSERLLAHLIAYLRAAMPRAGDASTLRRELELVSAWLAIVGTSAVAASSDERELGTPCPPMLLLPIVQSLDVARFGAPRIEARAERGRLQVSFVTQARPVNESALATVRMRLADLYGGEAKLSAGAEAGVTAILLDVPVGAQ